MSAPEEKPDPERRRIAVFFYGSFMNRSVLERNGLAPVDLEVARLWGFDIAFVPMATIVPAGDGDCVFGIVTGATPEEVRRLYDQPWASAYFPEAVEVETTNGRRLPALVYVAGGPTAAPPHDDYLDRILISAREHGFPESYIERVAEAWSRRPGAPAEAPGHSNRHDSGTLDDDADAGGVAKEKP